MNAVIVVQPIELLHVFLLSLAIGLAWVGVLWAGFAVAYRVRRRIRHARDARRLDRVSNLSNVEHVSNTPSKGKTS